MKFKAPDPLPYVDMGSKGLPTMAKVERDYVLLVIAAMRGNKTAAARVLGWDRRTLFRKLEEISNRARFPF